MQVMKAFGFSTQWGWLIFNFISTTHFFILMNDTARSYFKSSRGLHQGNHLSPDLFILIEEILSRMLNQAFYVGHIKPFISASGCPAITHLL